MTKLGLAQTKKTENCLKQYKVKTYSLKTGASIRTKYRIILLSQNLQINAAKN